ncbi:MAG TPA: tripartite tricarboxylate transporter substrate binding protein [Xanthobacteraceae bacterium]|nr:tripartite tricarboxylate transporter substrate binding protein [Xanthobacteraceae bacterium]
MGGARLWALAIAMIASAAYGQDYPVKPITLVNPYAAGGPADLLARTVAAGMNDLLGQQVVILNKPGGATAIGAAFVAAAAPDGYTLLIAGASSHIVTPVLSKVTYDGIKDFAPVAMVANVPNVLVVRASLPVKSVPELVALAKSRPAALNYGSVGNGSQPHLAAEMFKQMASVNFTHIPYKGAAPAITDLLAEQIDLAFLNAPPLLQHIQSGKLTALAVTTLKRARQLADVPTLDELGLRGFDVATWYGITAPAATPKPVVEKLTAVISKVLTSPDVVAKLTSQGAEIFLLPPKEFADYLQADAGRLTRLIKSANIQAE